MQKISSGAPRTKVQGSLPEAKDIPQIPTPGLKTGDFAKGIKDLTLPELEKILFAWGEKNFRAKQIFSWIYQKKAADFSAMSDLPEGLRQKLRSNFFVSSLKLAKALRSSDGTEKLLLELSDKNIIEAVSIPAKGRVSGCVSTQVGCKFCCCFCASAISGFKRNLSTAEILDEITYLKDNSAGQRLTHIVFMGTGEPFDNYANVLKAIRIINSSEGLNIGARRITISTCGVIPGIERLAKEDLQVELSISLHAAEDKIRNLIMPVNKIYPLKALLSACRRYYGQTNRQITLEYVLIKGLNSSLQNAQILSRILSGMDIKVNLIPANPIRELNIEPPELPDILAFKNLLMDSGVKVTLRKPRGQDIEAACGQLRLQYAKKTN